MQQPGKVQNPSLYVLFPWLIKILEYTKGGTRSTEYTKGDLHALLYYSAIKAALQAVLPHGGDEQRLHSTLAVRRS